MGEIIDVRDDRLDQGVRRAVEALRAGDLVVLPTDTRYGVAADAFNPRSTGRLFAATGRGRRFPLPVLVRSPKQLLGLCTLVPEVAERLMAAYWPGPLSMVIPSDPNLTWDLGPVQGTVMVRMPLDEVALAVIREVGPLAVTGAGAGAGDPGTTAAQAQARFGEEVAVYLDAGERSTLMPSTIVDLTRAAPHVLREGSIPAEQALAVARGELDPADVPPLDL